MAQQFNPDGSEDVNDFLVRIRELDDKRHKEDEERTRKLEEEILQGRKERQARRAERARSISPIKDLSSPTDGIANNKQSLTSPVPSQLIDPPIDLNPTSKPPNPDMPIDATATKMSVSPVKDAPLSRTLSWKKRPMSTVPSNNSTESTQEASFEPSSTQGSDHSISRASIIQSLTSKDPSWFRQTSDRGTGSPAYRKTQISDTIIGGSPRLPGLSREPTMETENQADTAEGRGRSRSPSRTSPTYGAASLANRFSSVLSVSTSGLGSPVPLSSNRRLNSRASSMDTGSPTVERVAMSPSQGRLNSERPPSPTKGLGGFVQSAMLKRSDSVSKRWSVQSGSGGLLGPVTPGTRSDGGTLNSSPRIPRKSPEDLAYDTPGTKSRPDSSHSEATVVRRAKQNDETDDAAVTRDGKDSSDGFVKPALPSRPSSRADSLTSTGKLRDIPITPSKTMDSRRWSPTKASWLESALNKPESPKSKSQLELQPEWKKDVNRIKQAKAALKNSKPDYPDQPSSETSQAKENQQNSYSTGTSETTSPQHKEGELGETKDGLTEADPVQTRPRIHPKPQLNTSTPPLHGGKSSLSAEPSTENGTSPTKLSVDTERAASSSLRHNKSVWEAASSKPKPPNTPVQDFRANLRREIAPEPKPDAELEFRNVLGKLRKTETKNYVAPDELKETILRGKASLNPNGGPQRAQKIDEFKETLLRQKEAIKSNVGSIRRNTIEDKKPAEETPVPEAIAVRNRMNRTGSIASTVPTSDIPPKRTSTLDTSKAPSQLKAPGTTGTASHDTTSSSSVKAAPNDRLQHHFADGEELRRQTQVEKPSEKQRLKDSSAADSPISAKADSQISVRLGKGGLADRLNPALTGLLSRGPPTQQAVEPSDTPNKSPSSPDSPAALTHITKSRARGPKRRPPGGKQIKNKTSTTESVASGCATLKPSSSNRSLPKGEDSDSPTNFVGPETSKTAGSSNFLETIRKRTQAEPPATNSLGAQTSNSVDIGETLPATHCTVPVPEPSVTYPSPITIPKAIGKPIPLPKPSASTVSLTDNLESPSSESATQSSKVSPVQNEASCQDDHPKDGAETKLEKRAFKRPSPPPRKPSFPRENRSESPRVPPKPRNLSSKKPVEPSIPPPQKSPFPQSMEASRIFSSFFDAPPKAADKVAVDPHSVLLSKSEPSPKVNTLKKQIWEITGDGRKKDLPVNQEYILFDENMYLCVHVFEVAGRTKTTQVHLWCGDGVSEASLEDAQLFARKAARENGTKLEILRQGKETSSFIQALGGIIITRRGSSSRASSSYMLCCRRHLDQISFDEVNLDPRQLCSGYPFIISSNSGKLYVWQGKGSGADELGCARLIGMDIGSTRDIEEVAEGEEPAEFFEAFPDTTGPTPYQSADYWRLKPSSHKYSNRLFRIDHSQGQRFVASFWNRRGASSPTRSNSVVQEIEPFCQRDLEPGHIYVLDAFFEIYVIVGEQAHTRSAELATALIFAQEYGILAVSEQDRPFMPKSSVLLDGITDECKRAFRKWDEKHGSSHPKPITVLPLDAAIEAIR
ncbi:hypothetical protein VTO42DRAFT_710 [Malbranchea cinnamomea]